MSDLTNYRRDLAVLETGRSIPQIQHNPPTATAASQIAPWMTNGSSTPSGTMPTSFFNDSSDNLSLASQLSPGYNPSSSRPGTYSDAPDASYFNDGRRPSAASILTASSTGSRTSTTRGGGFRKLQGFFGEEFPGRDSSESSLPASIAGKDHRGRSYSTGGAKHRDRNFSNATDNTRDVSPSSSRPRTPVPSAEVVPFLYQDNTVRASMGPPCFIALICAHGPHQPHRPLRSFRFQIPCLTLGAEVIWMQKSQSVR